MNAKFFHYLFENHPGEGAINRASETSIGLVLPMANGDQALFSLRVDHRDQRVLVVVDGELLLESIPKAGDCLRSVKVGELVTNIEHLRKPRFGTPSYRVETMNGQWVAKIDLMRHFLLLPCGNAVFRRFRDKWSLGPMYVFVEVKKDPKGPSVTWRNSTY